LGQFIRQRNVQLAKQVWNHWIALDLENQRFIRLDSEDGPKLVESLTYALDQSFSDLVAHMFLSFFAFHPPESLDPTHEVPFTEQDSLKMKQETIQFVHRTMLSHQRNPVPHPRLFGQLVVLAADLKMSQEVVDFYLYMRAFPFHWAYISPEKQHEIFKITIIQVYVELVERNRLILPSLKELQDLSIRASELLMDQELVEFYTYGLERSQKWMTEDVSRSIASNTKHQVQKRLHSLYKIYSRQPESIENLRKTMDRIALVTADEPSPERLLIMDFTQLWIAIHQKNAIMAEELWKYLVECDFYKTKSTLWIFSEFHGFFEAAERNGMNELQRLIREVLPSKLAENRRLNEGQNNEKEKSVLLPLAKAIPVSPHHESPPSNVAAHLPHIL
jgi:hypothetical protein